MSNEKYLVIAILAVTTTTVLAKPSGMDLSMAKDKTICRTVVDYDVSETRIPRVIKILKCAPDPYEMCPASTGRDERCCGAFPLAGGALFSCTEVVDSVLVNDSSKGTYTYNVPVGCACIRQSRNKAFE